MSNNQEGVLTKDNYPKILGNKAVKEFSTKGKGGVEILQQGGSTSVADERFVSRAMAASQDMSQFVGRGVER